ncbi:MAG TPA: WecB/TagA/CpsF family glycosyltransferase [Terriglobales bacterium]|jgi:N-acetylglucosaminyldiphosphoundecaprenol N-acetyl-beta-D-mannosaminyltransferase|nr:WecB/TagA/CpsF family glycosyltransferase [Terriglobales bacterium]
MPANRVEFLGCPVDNLSMEDAVATLERFIETREPHQIAVINANKLWQMEQDPRLATAVRGAALFIPEKAVVIGSRLLGLEVHHHIGGVMLLKRFLSRAEERGYRLYFFGAQASVLNRVVSNLRSIYEKLQIVGWHHGFFTSEEDLAIRKEIAELRPDALFVALGSPKQEFWIAQHLPELGVPVCMGVGGSFDVVAGIKRDAPDWIRALAMEWLFRLVQDPRNLWRRYAITMPWLLRKVLSELTRKWLPGFEQGHG